ncbi:MAG: PEP-CTERM sorting domain-containing protein [Planctomycetales bacterium]
MSAIGSRGVRGLAMLAVTAALLVAKPIQAGQFGTTLLFDTELTSLNLGGPLPFALPLGMGYGLVNSNVMINLSSSKRSLGQARASNNIEGVGIADNHLPTIDPDLLHGQQFFVNSFFDVFFDITVTDVDPTNNFAGQLDGKSFLFGPNGPASMQSFYSVIFDKNAPNFGIVPPPEASPYIGHFNITIPLGGDINGNGEDDQIKFTVATHSVGDEGRTFVILPDGTVVENFNSGAYIEGAVADISTDPPFTIGSLGPNGLPDPSVFGGPTSASSKLLNPVVTSVPEPATWLLSLVALGGLVSRRKLLAAA